MKMLSCRDVTRLVSEGLDRKLGLGERVALRVHYMMCSGCQRFGRQLEFLRKAVRRLGSGDGERTPQ